MSDDRARGPGAPVGSPSGSPKGLRLGRVAGVEVRLDWSLLIVFTLIAMALAGGLLPRWHPDWGQAKVLATAIAAAVLFLASILLHELAHAVVGRRLGVEIRRITLFVFGGMAHMEGEPRTWQAELGMAIAGPLASLGLGVLFLILAQVIAGPIPVDPEDPARGLAQVGPVATLLLWLGPVNIILGLFNLVPGFPLDGGRVLRAVLWGLTGDLTRSTLLAATVGQAFSWILIGLGFAMMLGLRVPFFGSGALGGLWLALIGWFLGNAARQSWQGRLIEDRLGALPVSRVMHHDYREVEPDLSVLALVDQGFLALSYRAYPVVAEGETPRAGEPGGRAPPGSRSMGRDSGGGHHDPARSAACPGSRGLRLQGPEAPGGAGGQPAPGGGPGPDLGARDPRGHPEMDGAEPQFSPS